MDLSGLLHGLLEDPTFARAARAQGPHGTVVTPDAGIPFLAAGMARARLVLAVTATSRQADDLAHAAGSLLGPARVAVLPAWETLPHERLSPSSDTVGRRLAVLRRLAHPDPADESTGALDLVVAPVRALLQPIVTGLGDLTPVAVHPGDQVAHDDLAASLVSIGYQPTDLVEKRGQFAIRGGILDVFPATEEHPLRVEFWGDDVEEIRYFRVADQRSLEVAGHGLWAPPCRELLLTPAVRARAAALAAEHPELAEMCTKLAEGIAVEGMEALSPVLAQGMETVLDVLARATDQHPPMVLLADPELVRTRAHDLVATSDEFLAASWHNAAAGNATPIDLGAATYRTMEQVREIADGLGMPWWTAGPFGLAGADADGEVSSPQDPDDAIVLPMSASPGYRGDGQALVADLRAALAAGRRVVAVTAGAGSAQRLAEQLAAAELAARVSPGLTRWPPAAHVVTVTTGRLGRGLDAPGADLLVVTEADIRGTRGATRDMTRMPSRRRNTVDPLHLAAGDFVVHEQHGVGRYVEMTQRTVGGNTREYLLLEYAASKRGQPPDRLYVPSDQLDQVTRYVGGEAPAVHRLGGADWQQTKSRARRAVRQIAGELIKLYAARQQALGHAFGPDTPVAGRAGGRLRLHRDPRSGLHDRRGEGRHGAADADGPPRLRRRRLRQDRDRGACGVQGRPGRQAGRDPGAHHAAGPAAPPDVHRPVLRLPAQGRGAVAVPDRQGGTRRCWPGWPTARSTWSSARTGCSARRPGSEDLGLLIVDEEQRFGVEHKEHIKALRTNVDVLTMSATPIPRTLEMAVTGIREMSTIATPPEERHPMLTYVGAYEPKQISAAIRRELLRDGPGVLRPQPGRVDRAGQRPSCASWSPRHGSPWPTAR